uniref:Peptide chain release factor 1-like, mitochondrial n=1 Tax=Lates calcarifer TaxID=8187 RepID=A0A4W6EXI6_LATCA
MSFNQTVRFQNHCGRTTRTFHTGTPSLVAKLLSLDELFARRSLQEYLKKMETEYSECLRAVNTSNCDKICDKLLQQNKYITELMLNHELTNDVFTVLFFFISLKSNCFTNQILELLIPEEEADLSDLILEVTAGVGGQEAMLFTAEVFDMYQGFAQHHGWSFDILEHMISDIGGLRHASVSISGPQSYKKMKFEAGVHRVQRIPKTEKQSRMHTSTMTVAVLPQPPEISFTINPKDLRIDTKRASGAGGQHVNTTDSAVRIVHLPTGVVAECQQERSQLKNREKAMKTLRAKLYSMKLEEETSKRYNQRKVQIGTKGRSEKIRTYNFAQDRITDHRIGITVHDVKSFLLGEDLLDEMNSSLQEFSNQETLMELLGEYDQEGS